ncbi:M42 family metallopeptidase [Rubeoparvulum massiliense]|uniref:M42 family metallopeptidase n=1 Tax=Rubeoparvulum massiliense TaxID=1631346 RepID=UPI00065DC802|nr:M42 family metallopeptidase [Rubeoparvulum massiliense]
MDQGMKDLFRRLTEAPGAAGFEDPVRQIMREELSKYTHEIVTDHLGSIFGVRRDQSDGPTVMVAGHMDEVGFMVTRIDDHGFIRFQALGGWWEQVLLAQRVQLVTKKGIIEGVIGSIPPHNLSPEARQKPMEMKNMFIDVGADSREEAEQAGIMPGTPVVPICPFTPMVNPKKLMAKAWDNRYGCGLAIQLLRDIQNETLPNVLYAGANVQEEVGLRGAATAANMIQPDIFFALDASAAGDIPGGGPEAFGKLGDGVLLRIYDRTMVTHPRLRDFVLDTAESNNIPYQFFISQGGTDAGRIHTSGMGVPSTVIGICSRYIHSHASIIHTDDYDAAAALLVQLVKAMDRTTVETIRAY